MYGARRWAVAGCPCEYVNYLCVRAVEVIETAHQSL